MKTDSTKINLILKTGKIRKQYIPVPAGCESGMSSKYLIFFIRISRRISEARSLASASSSSLRRSTSASFNRSRNRTTFALGSFTLPPHSREGPPKLGVAESLEGAAVAVVDAPFGPGVAGAAWL
jgi:hypothetical protein